MRIQRFEDVIAWQKAKNLTVKIRSTFAGTKDFSFRDQIFRASLSVMNNIAEGFDRGTDKELGYFLIVARGSTAEVRSMLIVAAECKYVPAAEQRELLDLTTEISKILTGFIKAVAVDQRLKTGD